MCIALRASLRNVHYIRYGRNHLYRYRLPAIVTTTGLFLVFCLDEDVSLRQEGDGMSAWFYLVACLWGKLALMPSEAIASILGMGFLLVFVIFSLKHSNYPPLNFH